MDVSKDSWHYKLLVFMECRTINRPVSLCRYFWLVVGHILLGLGTIFVGLLVMGGTIYATGDMFAVMFFGGDDERTVRAKIVACAYATVILMLVALYYAHKKDQKKAYATKKEPSLLTSYVNSRKEKFCPTINFVKEKSE